MSFSWFHPHWWVLGCCISTLQVQAQAQEDHLQPTKNYYTSGQADYYVKVQEVLCSGLRGKLLARVVVLPSGLPEYVVSLDQQAGKFYLTYQTVHKTSIWNELQTKTGVTPAVDAKVVELQPDVVAALTQVFTTALDQTRYPKPTSTLSTRNDGTTFTFIAYQPSIGWESGEIWSPLSGTTMGQLVTLVEHLRQVASGSSTPAAQAALLEESNRLTTELTH